MIQNLDINRTQTKSTYTKTHAPQQIQKRPERSKHLSSEQKTDWHELTDDENWTKSEKSSTILLGTVLPIPGKNLFFNTKRNVKQANYCHILYHIPKPNLHIQKHMHFKTPWKVKTYQNRKWAGTNLRMIKIGQFEEIDRGKNRNNQVLFSFALCFPFQEEINFSMLKETQNKPAVVAFCKDDLKIAFKINPT